MIHSALHQYSPLSIFCSVTTWNHNGLYYLIYTTCLTVEGVTNVIKQQIFGCCISDSPRSVLARTTFGCNHLCPVGLHLCIVLLDGRSLPHSQVTYKQEQVFFWDCPAFCSIQLGLNPDQFSSPKRKMMLPPPCFMMEMVSSGRYAVLGFHQT